MSDEFKIEIVNPEKSFLSKEDVNEVVVPAFEGEMGILKDHISIISFLKPGIIKICAKSEDQKYFVEDGTVEFFDNYLLILTSNPSRLVVREVFHLLQRLWLVYSMVLVYQRWPKWIESPCVGLEEHLESLHLGT